MKKKTTHTHNSFEFKAKIGSYINAYCSTRFDPFIDLHNLTLHEFVLQSPGLVLLTRRNWWMDYEYSFSKTVCSTKEP
jgi:hypothetical protein